MSKKFMSTSQEVLIAMKNIQQLQLQKEGAA
jgi:hypothetical protein